MIMKINELLSHFQIESDLDIIDKQLTKYQLAKIRKAMNHANKEYAKSRKKLNYGKNN